MDYVKNRTAILIVMLIMFGFTIAAYSQVIPKPDHVVIVIEENHASHQIIGSQKATYINKLATEGALFINAHGVSHPSQPNYIALYSGSIQGVTDDGCLKGKTPFTTPNLGHELISKGFTFGGYSEYMPKEGFTGCGVGKSIFKHGSPVYARKHNPWVDWQGNKKNGVPASVNKTLKSFPKDFSKLPTVSIVIPDEDNDMHNGPDPATIKRGDKWLKTHMSSYIKWARKHNSLFILTYDEDNDTPANHIPTLFVGQMVRHGKFKEYINHYSVLRTIEDMYGLGHAGDATNKAITGIWE
ncbi:MAG TPA: alkaline phosphatase family protein [Balneolales bacterium]|nr:alkaline phosphatase family protein [Balneolales bacterium]